MIYRYQFFKNMNTVYIYHAYNYNVEFLQETMSLIILGLINLFTLNRFILRVKMITIVKKTRIEIAQNISKTKIMQK